MGADDQLAHDDRYDIADEYLEVAVQAVGGLLGGRRRGPRPERGVYTDPAKVHPIEHDGTFFDVPGIHLCEPSPQRTPVIYQAGASPRGHGFAAKHAEAIFVGSTRAAVLKETVREDPRRPGRGRPRPLRRAHLHGC